MMSSDMAIVKVSYTPNGGRAKATIKYMQHRPGKEKESLTRTLFGSDGLMGRWEAYRMIDEAEHGSRFFRIIINPDTKTEDTKRDLALREVTQRTIDGLEERLQKNVAWIAVVHDDHTPQRHIHALAIVKERLLPVKDLRQFATEACLEQRHERDYVREKVEREQEAQWEQEQ